MSDKAVSGSIMVVGGGIGGIQSALDLAQSGYFVYLTESSNTLGGTMAMLDKTFPTNDCSTCMFSPKLVEAAGHPNIEIITGADLIEVRGRPGNFSISLRIRPRYIDTDRCIACGKCAEKCPKRVSDGFNGGLGTRKAAYLTFPQAVPLKYAIDPVHCLYLTRKRCGLCKKVCPADAVDFDQKPLITEIEAGALIISTGFEPALTTEHGEYGFGRYKNVVTALQYERMLSATGPHEGHPKRPSDGRAPKSVAWIQCVMSRDASRNRPFCSSVCCMHAAKQAILTRTHYPQTDATIYFMDVRAQGKGFDSYVDRARYTYGVKYKRSMISQVYLNPLNDNLVIETFDHFLNRKVETEYELVVLSSGLAPGSRFKSLAGRLGLLLNPFGFLTAGFDSPVATSRPGIFVCGGAEAPKDIPETVIQAGAAAAEASILLSGARGKNLRVAEVPEEKDLKEEARVGVFVCHCGTNIAGVVDVESVTRYARTLPGVVHADHFLFSCANETLNRLVEMIGEKNINRVVVAACSPKTHDPIFRDALVRAGLNPYLFELVSIRDQCSWVHSESPEKATGKAKSLVRAGVARALHLRPLYSHSYEVVPGGLVIGGGISGMSAALAIADQGFETIIVERSDMLGGVANLLSDTLEGDSPAVLLRHLEQRVMNHPRIKVFFEKRLVDHKGQVGAYEGLLSGPGGDVRVKYGAVVVATGGRQYQPDEYLYSRDKRVMTQIELSRRIEEDPGWAGGLKKVVMIQCVGSRNEEFPMCSRVCCSVAVKNSIKLKELSPGVQVVVLYRDIRTFGFKELFYQKARKMGVLFFRYIPEEPPDVRSVKQGLMVDFKDRSSHERFRVVPDLVVLSSGIRPSEHAAELSRCLKLPVTPEGFFLEAHSKLRPVEFPAGGIFLAGLAHSPRFIPESTAMARAAAQQAVKILSKKEMKAKATVAVVDPDRCAACLACVRLCPYGAPFINQDGVSEISPAQCQGCGICVSECPARAIELAHSTDDQITAKIDALLEC